MHTLVAFSLIDFQRWTGLRFRSQRHWFLRAALATSPVVAIRKETRVRRTVPRNEWLRLNSLLSKLARIET